MDNVLEKIKAKSFYHNFFEDGSWDLYAGLMCIFLAITFTIFENYDIGILRGFILPCLMGLNYLIYKQYKKQFTYPRIGKGNFDYLTKSGPAKNFSLLLAYLFLFGFNILNLFYVTKSQHLVIYISSGIGIITGVLMVYGGWKNNDKFLIAGLVAGIVALFVQCFFITWAILIFLSVLVPITMVLVLVISHLSTRRKEEIISFPVNTKTDLGFLIIGLLTIIINAVFCYRPEYLIQGIRGIYQISDKFALDIIVFAGIAVIEGLFYKMKRIIGYGLLLILVMVVTDYFKVLNNHIWQYIITGVIILMVTLAIGKKFLKKYPVLE